MLGAELPRRNDDALGGQQEQKLWEKMVVEQIQSEGVLHAHIPESKEKGITKLFEHIRIKTCEQITNFTCVLAEDPTRGMAYSLDHTCAH